MTPASRIQNYLLLHLSREFPGLDVWRANVVGRAVSLVAAGEPGQADLTGVWGGRCARCRQLCEECAQQQYGPLYVSEHLFTPAGRSVWIEVKSPGDSQSKTQRDFERRVTRLGALYILCRVRKRDTVAELEAMKHPERMAVHPAEIQSFFDELRERL